VSIVDDDEDIVYLFQDALKDIKGYSVFAFTDPKLAIEHFEINVSMYALIITDLRMPGMNGLELIKKIKDRNQSVRTIIMTAFDYDDELFNEYITNKIINGFLQKPVRISQLRNEVKNFLSSQNPD
jgi:DNA-binding NtrC family response regulator